MLTLALSPWVPALLIVLFLGICVLLILTVLIQRPQGGGLSGAFGSGAGSGQTAFGAKTGDALTIATISIFLLYLLVAIGLNYAIKPGSDVEAETVPVAVTEDGLAIPAEDVVTDEDAVETADAESGAADDLETSQTTDATDSGADDESGGQ